jgi:hypothetical protein
MPYQITYHGLTCSIRQWAELLDFDYYTLLARIRRGWPPEKALEMPLRHKGVGPTTHGATHTKEYRAWKAMLGRCSYPGYHAYHRYGGRGLEVCEQWRESFETFLSDVELAPSPHLTLGRIDNDSGYRPGNVFWQTAAEQATNRARPRPRRTSGT